MTQVTLQFENNIVKERLLKIIELMNGVSVVKPQTKCRARKTGLDEAKDDIKAGRVFEYASVNDFFSKMGV